MSQAERQSNDTEFQAKGWYTLPVRTGRKDRPYVRPVRKVYHYGPKGCTFDTRVATYIRMSHTVWDTRTYGS